jgi:3-deoxy-7-phosphoheptulonate synthase
MLVMMSAHVSAKEVRAVCRKIEEMGYKPHPIPGATRTAIGITGNRGPVEAGGAALVAAVQGREP